ncbi:MAG: class IV adenylate cyclase, partial [Candidatus Peribacteria bacterium]|nr:class IV adenylate cyclase [Candidatus Peribacteria bacterium]
MQDIEVELKFHLPEGENNRLLVFLESNAQFTKEIKMKDSYYMPIHRDFTEVRPIIEWLRIRKSDKGHSVNYKNRIIKDGVTQNYCDEFNTSLEKPEQLEKIFLALDIKPLIVVDKVRKSFIYQQVEVSLDTIEALGDFVELEMKGQFETPEEAREKLYQLAERLGLQKEWQDTKGYP